MQLWGENRASGQRLEQDLSVKRAVGVQYTV